MGLMEKNAVPQATLALNKFDFPVEGKTLKIT